MKPLNEDTLVQATMADYLADALGWDSVYAFNTEILGPEGTLGRASEKDVILTRHLGEALIRLNPGLPASAYADALRQITDAPLGSSLMAINRDAYALLKDGVQASFRNAKGELVKQRLRLIDFDTPENNHFLCVRELWIKGDLYRRRADIVGFVNGLPLLFVECKAVHKDIRHAYEQNLSDYKDTIPHLFHHNAFIILTNGHAAKIGSLSSRYEHFNDWKRLEEDEPGVVDLETMLKGICTKDNFIDILENFILFDDGGERLVKIVARNHQFLGVNRAIAAVKDRKARSGKLGVFWHTQGSGKSYSIAFLTQKVHRKIGANFTFLVCTDRIDLDSQIYSTFAGCGLVNNDKAQVRAGTGAELKSLLAVQKPYVFTLIHRFNQDVNPNNPYSDRDDIIVITDEAHRTQNGLLSLNMRNALPNASFLGFTGTPLMTGDETTKQTFGDYISTYDFQRAVEDNATVPLYYDARGDKLGVATNDLNERIAAKLEELELDDPNLTERLENELKREYHIITAETRLDTVAADFVEHYTTGWESGKAMLVCIDKVTCVRMHALIAKHWDLRIASLEEALAQATDEQDLADRQRQLAWVKSTRAAVVVSEEQGEVDKFRKWDLDIVPHRALIKNGFETDDGKRIDLETAFKKQDHPFRIAIVCAMWLTGFDVPSLSTLYLDKPLKAHTLMQAIARANRVSAGKNNGLIVDYCGILKNLRKALATYAGTPGGRLGNPGDPPPEVDPVRPPEELLADLEEAIEAAEGFLSARKFRLLDILEKVGFDRNKAIIDAKEAVNENDESRKRFQIMAREVFKKFKACVNFRSVNAYRQRFAAIKVIYNSLEEDVKKADISDIMRELHAVVNASIETQVDPNDQDDRLYDISRIDFEKLKKEFERSPRKNTTVQSLKDAVQKKLEMMLRQNPLRTDFQKHYEQLVSDYNSEKDAVNIERTFAALLVLAEELDGEQRRAVREGLDEETLALFDLLMKPDLEKSDIAKLKKVAVGLYEVLKQQLDAVQDFAGKQATRDAVRVAITNFLYDDRTGLPQSYEPNEVDLKAQAVFAHMLTRRSLDLHAA
ncbi:type I restriction endonuclease subunit R [Acetobacter peroxydans]|uniref:Type I restriction enzyme endonuclease subunit n=2 Tax=Acetobacter peroxydans TaxID=104098 RepID=A0A4Y3TUY8_9PROT|nr:type I restriction endonuclease subunit R [Acetobacter peroxydans]NHO16185.1 HsdR family type I site-specific deoxyribonuclease [Acetobacter peroxydans]GBR40621.1 type I restriction-modification system R subunit [Acetobacter peroxydans]GEB85672.1 DEAD/DEAH box helicase [Acetobacter peroxydans]